MSAYQLFGQEQEVQHAAQESDDDDPTIYRGGHSYNSAGGAGCKLTFYGNERTMNLNPLILTNIQGSPYFKVELYAMKTFHEIVDQIYYKVDHLEPWATGSRKTAGRSQTGMCGGVRGVSAGGIVSSCFCLLFKLHTLKLTKKQVVSLLNHCDSPYIRGLGFMFLRFTLPAANMWDWFEPYLDDEEEIDIKAGGGKPMTIGEMCKLMLTRLEWFDTRFPRINVNVEKEIRQKLEERSAQERQNQNRKAPNYEENQAGGRESKGREVESRESRATESREKEKRRERSGSRERKRSGSRDRKKERSDRKKSRSRSRSRKHKKHKRSRSRERRRSRSGSRQARHAGRRERDYAEELRSFDRHRKRDRRSRSR